MKQKINIGFLMGHLTEKGGISRVTSILTNKLIETNLYNIHIFSFHPCNKNGYDWSDQITYHDILDHKPSMKKGILKATFKLRKLISKKEINVLICCGHIVGPLGVLSSILKKTKLYYWSHSSFVGEDFFYKSFNEKFTAAFSNTVITLTKTDKINYKRKTFAKKVVQIYNPIDQQLLDSNHSYDADTKKILSVGRITKSKNFDTYLLEVAQNVLSKNEDYTWQIYGSGECEEELKKNIKNLGLQGRVLLKGHAANIYDVYNQHSILVMTSSYEGFPMALLEGTGSKLPLVSFDVPTGPNEIITNHINGFLIPPFSILEMSQKLDFLMNSKSERLKFSQNSKEVVKEFYPDVIIAKWNQILS